MSNETDLDWLARNVHVWVPGELLRMKPCDNGSGTFRFSWCYSDEGGFTKDQWLARRAELQNKPSWTDAPGWAEWLAQDAAGSWLWHSSSEPESRNGMWIGSDTKSYAAKGCVLGDWRDTLERRPEQNEFETFVSVEDANPKFPRDVDYVGKINAATSKQQAITPSKYTKTIHGVSVDVYDVLQAWGVSNPALQHLIKKALQCGQRGHKDNEQDLQDIIDSAIRAKELG